MISTAAKCSLVYGCGQGWFPAIRRRAESITAAPASIVAMSTSWPGQSTKDTCLKRWRFDSQPLVVHFGLSYFSEPKDL
jgi:hypothetical protein